MVLLGPIAVFLCGEKITLAVNAWVICFFVGKFPILASFFKEVVIYNKMVESFCFRRYPKLMASEETNVREVRQYSRQLVRELDVVDGVYLGTGYSLSQCHVLFELSRHQALNLMGLSASLLADKSNISRTLKKLIELGLVQSDRVDTDHRQKMFSLTVNGKKVLKTTIDLADQQVRQALENLTDEQQQQVIKGMQLYAGALKKSRLQSKYEIRKIQKRDNPQIARLIREVLTEYQAIGAGSSIDDTEVSDMFASYHNKLSCYQVVTADNRVVGGAGIGPLAGGGKSVCELRKMFFLPELRGFGMGRRLLMLLLDEARERGYKKCYLETLDRMWQANALYRKCGFELLAKPLGNTGHKASDCWYAIKL